MPIIRVPEKGLKLEGFGADPSAGSTMPNAIGVTLTNGMIEDMIKCVQNGKPIQLSLGPQPSLSYGNKTQQFSTFDDPFTHELYRSSFPTEYDESNSDKMAGPASVFMSQRPRVPTKMQAYAKVFGQQWVADSMKSAEARRKRNAEEAAVKSGGDSAVMNLVNSMGVAEAKKLENTTKLIEAPGRNLKKPGNKQLLGTKLDGTRSLSASPSRMGGSPSLGPTSVPVSEQQAAMAKITRKPVVHLLALGPISEKALMQKLPDMSTYDIKQALIKVADEDTSTNRYELKRNSYKELDVWSFDYDTQEDRQKVIDIAVKVYDKLRLSQSEPEWERLKPKSKRGDGTSLSKLLPKIAQGPIPRTPKINVQKAESGRDTPNVNDDDLFGEKKGEPMSRSSSQHQKKKSEKEAQAKRLANPPKKTVTKPASKPIAKKEKEKAKGGKILSSEFVNESDEEDDYMKEAPAPKAKPAKRAREEESSASSDSSVPLSKKVKKDTTANIHRVSDASQVSRSTNTSTTTSSTKTKGTSPQKSSPLASSPPTNASDFGDSSSASSTPARTSTKNSRSPIRKRHQKSSSVTSSTSSVNPIYPRVDMRILDIARKYISWYPAYITLHTELSDESTKRDMVKEEKLFDMHSRLGDMKKEILDAMADE